MSENIGGLLIRTVGSKRAEFRAVKGPLGVKRAEFRLRRRSPGNLSFTA